MRSIAHGATILLALCAALQSDAATTTIIGASGSVTASGAITFTNYVVPQAAAPTFNPNGGLIPLDVIASSATPGATIYWSTNSWTATNSGTSPVTNTVNTETQMVAYATVPGYTASTIATSQLYSVFLPDDVSGCVLWLKPETLTNDYAQGDSITNWSDSSPNASKCTNAVVASCPYVTNGIVNGYPAAWFDGVDDILTNSLGNLHRAAYGASVFIVARHASSGTDTIYGESEGSGGSVIQWRVSLYTGSPADLNGTQNYNDSLTPQSLGAAGGWPNARMQLVEFHVDWENSTQEILTNTVSHIADTDVTSAPTTDTDSLKVQVGGGNWHGEIVEVLVYNNKVGVDDLTSIRNWFHTKYALW